MAKEKTKDQRITTEFNRLKNLFGMIPANTLKAVESLLRAAAFMTITMQDLQQTINDEGAVSKYQNGENQWGTKKSPEVEIYNTMIRNHAAVIKQLTDLIPDDGPIPVLPAAPPPKKPDAFEKIVARKKQRE